MSLSPYLSPLVLFIGNIIAGEKCIVGIAIGFFMSLTGHRTVSITSNLHLQSNPLAFGYGLFQIEIELSIPSNISISIHSGSTQSLRLCLVCNVYFDTLTCFKWVLHDVSKLQPTGFTVTVSNLSLSGCFVSHTFDFSVLNPETGPTWLLLTLKVTVDDEFFLSE